MIDIDRILSESDRCASKWGSTSDRRRPHHNQNRTNLFATTNPQKNWMNGLKQKMSNWEKLFKQHKFTTRWMDGGDVDSQQSILYYTKPFINCTHICTQAHRGEPTTRTNEQHTLGQCNNKHIYEKPHTHRQNRVNTHIHSSPTIFFWCWCWLFRCHHQSQPPKKKKPNKNYISFGNLMKTMHPTMDFNVQLSHKRLSNNWNANESATNIRYRSNIVLKMLDSIFSFFFLTYFVSGKVEDDDGCGNPTTEMSLTVALTVKCTNYWLRYTIHVMRAQQTKHTHIHASEWSTVVVG